MLGLVLVLATTISLLIQAFAQTAFEAVRLVPVAFTGAYLWIHLSGVYRLAKQTYYAVPVPYSICLAQTREWFEAAARQQEQKLLSLGLAWREIQRTFKLHHIDWQFFDERRLGVDADSWIKKVETISNHFDHLTNRVPIQPVYHIFLALPGTLSLALGAKIGRRIPVVVYQHAGMVKDPYVSIFNTENIDSHDGYHLLNKRIEKYELLEITEVEEYQESSKSLVLVVLDFTGHELRKPYPQCGAKTVVRLRLKSSHGHIPLEADWVAIAHEISSFLYSYLDEDEEVHLLPGMPASLAFIVGTILGTVPGVWLYHFNLHDGEYTEPFSLHAL